MTPKPKDRAPHLYDACHPKNGKTRLQRHGPWVSALAILLSAIASALGYAPKHGVVLAASFLLLSGLGYFIRSQSNA